MTREVMDAQLGRLVVLRGMPGETDDYFAALSDIPADLFASAIDHALKTRTWFPVPAELRADCDAVRSRALASVEPIAHLVADLGPGQWVEIHNPLGGPPLRLLVTRDWKHDCDACRDTGWASHWCDERKPHQDYSVCGRKIEHRPHEYVDKCACVEWNPTIRRRKEAAMKYAQAPERAA
jgi:hypothetical protein